MEITQDYVLRPDVTVPQKHPKNRKGQKRTDGTRLDGGLAAGGRPGSFVGYWHSANPSLG
jgi:hypothetical protein